ncbi:MAG: SDR family NAD(P)-dependent oxidoreductase [Chitinophagaceae bacterium]|nr:SDR family NAD(P)-dependent oxidoreductase [Chitinophagaceae bacterium]
MRHAMITGATSGIGKSTALLFAKNKWNLILTGRREERLKDLKESLQQEYGIQVQTLAFDVRDLKQVQVAISSIDKHIFSTIDVLVNNAGLAAGFGAIDQGEYADWDLMLDTNVKGLLYMTKEIIPFMKNQGFGHIVNIGSTAGKDVYPNGNVYCASKHAVDALSKSMRIDLLPYGIKVTSINPGACETEFSLVRFKGDEEKAGKVYEGFKPLSPEDVADAIYYVCNLPTHVCINDLTLTCLTQANANHLIRNNS